MHNFKSSLAKGKVGEALLLEAMPELVPLNGRRSDFIHSVTEELYELKSDQYDMRNTENFFIETWSDLDKKKRGGPWQALEHNSKYWIYMFVKNRTLFVFNTAELVNHLDGTIDNYDNINIPNIAWTTQGIKVPRTYLWHLHTEVTF